MHHTITWTKRQSILSLLITSVLLIYSLRIIAIDKQSNPDLLNQYISSLGYQNTIIFDASNIKQYWIDNSILSKNNSINIYLSSNHEQGKESVPLKIQLANVNEAQDCKVEVISETEDFSFSILNNSSKVLSFSERKDDFLNYSVASSVFHLEDTFVFSFSLKFNSNTKDVLSIKKIILSFSENKNSSFIIPPNTICYNDKEFETTAKKEDRGQNSFCVSGKRISISSSKKFFTTDNTLSCSITVKNIGENATTLYLGYAAYNKEHVWLNGRNYPYKNINKVLNVVSHSEGSNVIVVDTYTEWGKGCYLAVNAKDDLSDIPNNTFIDGKIIAIKKLENGQAEITMDKPIRSKINEGTKIRVHGFNGAYLYTNTKVLQPGEEQTFTSSIKKDNSFTEYSPKAFSRGVYYVSPIILSYSVDSDQENTILIKDYTVNSSLGN